MPLSGPIRPRLDAFAPLLSDQPDFSIVKEPARWDFIQESSKIEGLAGIIAYGAREHVTGLQRAWCDSVLASNWAQHDARMRQLDRVLGELEDAHVQVIALKGPLLARRYYELPFLRKPSIDLDFAVRRPDLVRACDALTEAGYQLEYPVSEAVERNHHVALNHRSRPRIELHVRLSHGVMGIPVAALFDRAIPYALPSGRTAWLLNPADEILHLILHRSYGGTTLFHLYELRRIWRHAAHEVQREVVRCAIEHRFAGVLRLTDAAFRAYWDEPFLRPELPDVNCWLAPRIDDQFYREFERLAAPDIEVTRKVWLRRKWLEVQLTDSPLDAGRWIARLARAFLRTLWCRLRQAERPAAGRYIGV